MTDHDTTRQPLVDGSLADLPDTVHSRRRALRFLGAGALGGAGLVALAACDPTPGSASSSSSSTTAVSGGGLTAVPEETAGPYPGDGSNGPNVLTQDGIVRSDIRSSFGAYRGTATGVPLTVKLRVLDAATSAALAGAAIYIWHCDIDGHYSLYTVSNQNYLRGVQVADASGDVTFTSVYPACYSGRWPHIHFEVYPDVSSITSARSKLATSQLALPASASDVVYASPGYEASVANASRVTLASDMVFSDGAGQETPTVTGSVANGYTASLTVAVNA